MKKFLYAMIPLLLALAQASCVEEEEYADNPEGNFEALWKSWTSTIVSSITRTRNTDWTGTRCT